MHLYRSVDQEVRTAIWIWTIVAILAKGHQTPILALDYHWTMGYEQRLREALLSWGDLELRFTAGPSICVHSVKLALASSVLRALMDDVIDDQLASAKRRKASDGTAAEQMPSLKVGPLSLHECCHYEREAWPRPALIIHATSCRSMASTMTGSRC